MIPPHIETLLAHSTLADMADKDSLNTLAELINFAADSRSKDVAHHAIVLAGTIDRSSFPGELLCMLEYFISNAWAAIYDASPAPKWDWKSDELGKQIFHLRLAVQAMDEAHPHVQCQVLTNLGNALSHVGRFIEAEHLWSQAIAVDARFSMALGNRGQGRSQYAGQLYDQGHAHVFLAYAHRDLGGALSVGDLRPEVSEGFEALKRRIEAWLPRTVLKTHLKTRSFALGRSKRESEYRSWCLAQRLFLNPLNDLGTDPISARDVLHLPDMRAGIHDGTRNIGFYNEMKQEFASARFLLFAGTTSTAKHFSDREVVLLDTLDYPEYGWALEQTKLAFRAMYSLLDKIAFYINHYFDLKIPETRVAFKSCWYKNQDLTVRAVRDEFKDKENWPLRGLFWLSRDLFEHAMTEVLEPQAQAIANIRNHLEHKYLKVVADFAADAKGEVPKWDALAMVVGRTELESKAIRLAQFTRSGLQYLAFAIAVEEKAKRSEEKEPHTRLFPKRIPDDAKT